MNLNKVDRNELLDQLFRTVRNLAQIKGEDNDGNPNDFKKDRSIEFIQKSLEALLFVEPMENRRFSKCDLILYDETREDLIMLELNKNCGVHKTNNIREGLLSAVTANDIRRWKLLTNSKVQFDFTEYLPTTQKTLLHVACERGCVEICRDLLKRFKVPVNIRKIDYSLDRNGPTPLHCAFMFGRRKIFKLLLAHEAKTNIKFQGVTVRELQRARKRISRSNVAKIKSIRKLKKLIPSKVRLLMNSSDLKSLFERLGYLKWKRMKTTSESCLSKSMMKSTLVNEKAESRRKELFDLRQKLKKLQEENAKLQKERKFVEKVNTPKKSPQNKKIADLSKTYRGEKGPEMGIDCENGPLTPNQKELENPQPVTSPYFLKQARLESEKKKRIKRGIEEMREIARKEKILRSKMILKRRLSAAYLSKDVNFLRKFLEDMRENVRYFDITELDEYWKIVEKVKRIEEEEKKRKDIELEKVYEQFDRFSVPSISSTMHQELEQSGVGEERMNRKSPKKFDDVMITSIYAIGKQISQEKDGDEDDEELKELMEDWDVL